MVGIRIANIWRHGPASIEERSGIFRLSLVRQSIEEGGVGSTGNR
jgi:hypothetical protein